MNKPMTRYGLRALRDKVQLLKAKMGQELQAAGEAARENPNAYHDNFEYEEGMRQQQMFAERLRSMVAILGSATEAPMPEGNNRVAVGHLTRMVIDGEDASYIVGGPDEGMFFRNVVSAVSPLGRSLVGMKAGEEKTATINGRPVHIKVSSIRIATEDDFEPTI